MSSKPRMTMVALTAFMLGLACSYLAAPKQKHKKEGALSWHREGKTVWLKTESDKRFLVVGAYPVGKKKVPPVRYVEGGAMEFRGGEQVTVFELLPRLSCRYGDNCVPCEVAIDCPVPPIPPVGPVGPYPSPRPGPRPGPIPTGDHPWAVWPAP